jgi:hypothetical protein
MKHLLTVLSLLVVPPVQAAEAPTLRDFAWRQPLEAEGDLPIQELVLPDGVYLNVLDAGLGDLRVFNADGSVVRHALCPAPVSRPADPRLETLSPFPLQPGSTPVAGESGRIEIRTADGANVTITGPAGSAAPVPNGPVAYILDLRALDQPVRAIRLDWQSADQASEATISLKASEDLAQWLTLMPSATLLRAQLGDQSLQRARIPLPERSYRFLRIEAGASGPLPEIATVVVERVTAPDPVPATWVEAGAIPPDNKETATAFWFNAARRAPVHSADLRLPAANMALGVVLQSRDDPAQPWRTRWRGEVFALSSDSAQRGQTVVQFELTADRYWRLEVQRGAETLRGLYPNLLLGYRPARLRFLAQGAGPYQLAYGSARVERQQPACDSLLADLPAGDRNRLTGKAGTSAMPLRSNLDALKPLPRRTPLRQILLWGMLIAGALLVAAMALTLLKRLRQE